LAVTPCRIFTVTTKEIPKRELREGGEGWRYLWWHIGLVTTKEIPKRELRDQLPQFLIRPVRSDGYNKRNPKKGIESRDTLNLAESSIYPTSYNKRNPKKGIESLPPYTASRYRSSRVTTKEIPKRELRGASSELLNGKPNLYSLLQQKKSQKGN
jgi:hypothetical protein